MNYSVDLVPPSLLNTLWPYMETWVEKAMEGEEYTTDYVFEQLSQNLMTAFAVVNGKTFEGVVLLMLEERPETKVCIIFGIGGINMEKWLDQISRIVAFAKEEQCQAIEFMGRKGWTKMLEPYGFVQTKIVARHEL